MVKPTAFDSWSIFTSPQKSLIVPVSRHVLCLNQATLICFCGKQLVKIKISLTCEFSTTLLAHQCLQETFPFPSPVFLIVLKRGLDWIIQSANFVNISLQISKAESIRKQTNWRICEGEYQKAFLQTASLSCMSWKGRLVQNNQLSCGRTQKSCRTGDWDHGSEGFCSWTQRLVLKVVFLIHQLKNLQNITLALN